MTKCQCAYTTKPRDPYSTSNFDAVKQKKRMDLMFSNNFSSNLLFFFTLKKHDNDFWEYLFQHLIARHIRDCIWLFHVFLAGQDQQASPSVSVITTSGLIQPTRNALCAEMALPLEVCACVVCICLHVYTHLLWNRARMCTSSLHSYIHIYTCIYMYIYIYIYIWNSCGSLLLCIHTHTLITSLYTCVYVYVHIDIVA
jgi:hypothetical protein